MKKLKSAVWGVALVLCAMLANSSVAFAAESGAENVGKTLSLTYCIPFVGMLLCIAICPLIVGEWWEKWKPAVVIFWSLVFIVPFATFIGAGTAWEQVLESIIGDYLGFIVLLFGLFCVAGNIVLERSGRHTEAKCTVTADWYCTCRMDRYNGCQYGYDPSADPCQQVASAQGTDRDILHFPGIQYRWMSDSCR